jgi:hypothetical protein
MMMKTGVACNDWYAPNPEWVYAAPAKEYTDLFGDTFDDVDDVYVNVEEGIVVTSENANKLAKDYKTPFDKIAVDDLEDDYYGEIVKQGERYIDVGGYKFKIKADTTIAEALALDPIGFEHGDNQAIVEEICA